MTINNVVLVGRLTKDADLRYTQQGQATATFSLAVNRNFKNGNGEREADFINCVIWRQQAELLANMTHKGSLIGVTGRIQTRNYENQQGQRVFVTEVVADNFQLLEPKSSGQQGNQNGGYNNQQQGGGNYQGQGQQRQQGGYNQGQAQGQVQGGYNNQQQGNSGGYGRAQGQVQGQRQQQQPARQNRPDPNFGNVQEINDDDLPF